MAIAYASVATAGDRTCTPLTITKPTGLAVGDLLIVYLSTGFGTGDWTLPAGWTLVRKVDNGAGVRVALMAKLAEASDVSASNFSFTGTGDGIGILSRWTGNFNSVASVNASVMNVSGLTTTGVDPVLGGALVMYGSILSAGTSGGVFSGYSVVTSNPTWTEIIDGRYNDLEEIHYFMAWGSRSASTATGNSSVTEGVGGGNYGGTLIALVESTGADGTQTTQENLALGVNTHTISVGTTGNQTTQENLTLTANTPTSDIDEDKWTNQSKATPTEWTNQLKS